jgi:hypothetical protein
MKFLLLTLLICFIKSRRRGKAGRYKYSVLVERAYLSYQQKSYYMNDVYLLNMDHMDYLELEYEKGELPEGMLGNQEIRTCFGLEAIDALNGNLLLFPISKMKHVQYIHPLRIAFEFLCGDYLTLQFKNVEKLREALLGYIQVHGSDNRIEVGKVINSLHELIGQINSLNKQIKKKYRR